MACLLTPPPTPSSKPFIDLPTKLRKVRERLVDSGTYLGSTSIRKNITWARFGKAQKAVFAFSSATEANSITSSCASSPSDPAETDDSTAVPEVTVLSIVVQIGQDDFYLTSDGGYHGPSKFIKSLAHVKPSCSGGVPEAEPFSGDYTTSMDNLRWLLGEATTPGFKEKRGVMIGPGNAARIKVRHLLFKVSPHT
jgi:hypothetical protein